MSLLSLPSVASTSSVTLTTESRDTTVMQPTLQTFLNRTKKFDINNPKAQAIHNAITRMICTESLPFNFVESDGFKHLINKLCPKYQIPNRKYFSDKVVPKLYRRAKEKLREHLNTVTAFGFAVTTDIWTAKGNHDYISVTAHFIDNTFKKNHVVLDVIGFEGATHNAVSIAENLREAFREWGIEQRVKIVLSDNAANMKAAMRQLHLENIGCTVHTLQLIVNSGCLNNFGSIKIMLHSARAIVTHFKHSVSSMKSLHSAQKTLGMKQKTLLQDEPTRWDSTYIMLERLWDQKSAISMVSSSANFKNMSRAEWSLAENVLKILKHFYEATKSFSKHSSGLSDVWALIESLKTIMKDYLTEDDADSDVTAATKEISSQISKRFGEIKNNETYILATALDPRYKAQLFSDETKDELKDLLKENYPLRYANDHERSPQQYQEFDTLDKTEEAGTITLFSVTKKLLLSKKKSDEHSTGTTSKNKNIDRDIENEISVYLHERTEPLESDPVEFWKKEIRFPHLKKLAAYYLAIPAGSVFSEQIFSETGCIVTSKRTSLTAEHVKQLIFLKKNWMILEK
jgi:hypothetical protein